MPPLKYTIDFFWSVPPSASASVRSASSRRSVFMTLISVSSAVNAAPLSGVPSESPVEPSSKPKPPFGFSWSSVWSMRSRSSVKSSATFHVVDSVTTETRSDGVSFPST